MNLTVDCWLVISEGQRYSSHGTANVRLAVKKPSLRPGELPIRCRIEVPRALFQTPQFTAKIQLPEPDTSETDVKITGTLQELARAVEQNIGIKINFEKVENE